MPPLPRFKPDPLPTLHPVPEYAVDGARADWYAETKAVMQVPWVGVVAMCYAHYPEFFAAFWNGVRNLAGSRAFVDEAEALRVQVEADVQVLDPPPIAGRLAAAGYAAREIEEIRALNGVFSHGNQLYCLIATIARLLMEGREMAGACHGSVEPYMGRHAPETKVPFVLVEHHHADHPTRAVYDDIKATLGLPFVNTDYRAYARWPTYWAMAWGDLRTVVATPEHEAISLAYHDRAVAAVAERLPNPSGLATADLHTAAAADASVEEILDVCRVFQWLLPGLAVNSAYLRAQLMPAG
jgi:hypothetical protein